MSRNEIYLGGGLFASHDDDGIKLREERDNGESYVVTMTHRALDTFLTYIAALQPRSKEDHT